MYYKSWKRLTDQVLTLGGLVTKETPRTMIKEFLMEAEEMIIQKAGISEGILKKSTGLKWENNTNQILLPQYVGKIKAVYCGTRKLIRQNSSDSILNMNATTVDPEEMDEGSPTHWNMLGERIIQFNVKLESDTKIRIAYEGKEASDHLLLRSYFGSYNGIDDALDPATYPVWEQRILWAEPHADKEFADFWNGEKILTDMYYYNTSVSRWDRQAQDKEYEVRYGTSAGTCASGGHTTQKDCVLNSLVWTETDKKLLTYGGIDIKYTGTINNTNIDELIPFTKSPTSLSAIGETEGNGQRVIRFDRGVQGLRIIDWDAKAHATAHTIPVFFADTMVYRNYRTKYGPTINKHHQKVLPYYALAMVLMSSDPKLGEFYMSKFHDHVDKIADDFLDNDLTFQIETEIRSNVQEGGY
jgi:hypothetical protein